MIYDLFLYFQSSITLQKANSSKKVDRASPVKSPVEDPTKSLSS